jgi:hypothetical protein
MNEDQSKADGTLPATDRQDERRPGLRALGVAAARLAAPIVARHGGGVLARLKADWPAVIGAETAAATWPQALGRDGALKLRVAAAALELQHRAPLLIERINLYLGRPAISRLVFVQGPLPLAPPPVKRRPAPEPGAEEEAAIERQIAAIGDSELKDALIRLGKAVVSGAQRRR